MLLFFQSDFEILSSVLHEVLVIHLCFKSRSGA